MQYDCGKEHGVTLELYRKVNRCSCRGEKKKNKTTKKAVVGKKAFTVYWSMSFAYRNRQNKELL